MITREVETGAHVPHRSAQRLRQLDDVIPAVWWTGGEVGDDRDAIGTGQSVRRFLQSGRICRRSCRNVYCTGRRHLDVMIQLRLLQAGIVNHVDRSLARAHHH